MKAQNWKARAATAMLVFSLAAVAATETTSSTGDQASGVSAPAGSTSTNAPAPTQVQPARIQLPADLAEIVRMAQAGISDQVIVSYIQKSPAAYSPSADQIVYLRDLGISSPVLQTLVTHKPAETAQVAESTTPAAPPPPAAQSTAAESSAAAPEAQAQPPASLPPAANYFYSSLAPYGNWLDLPGYGWCWQPTVMVTDPGWRPYCDDGNWLWTDNGWYWNSYYSWGWAPFHYGRWFAYPDYGWLWCPDQVWGPAWVCWRDSSLYCGWAPLPPGAYFNTGLGWFFNGVYVGVGFDFGLAPDCFTFVDYDHFCDRHPFHHFRFGRDADHIYRGTRPHNDFVMDSHHRIVDRSIDPRRVEAVTHRPVREVAVRELPRGAGRVAMPGRLERSGNSMVIYRPNSRGPAPRNPFLSVASGRETAGVGGRGFGVTRGFGGRAKNSRGAALLMPHGSATARSFREPTGSTVRQNASRWNEQPGRVPIVRAPVSRASPTYVRPQREYVQPAAPRVSRGQNMVFPRANPPERFSAQPIWRVNPGFQAVRPSPAPTYRPNYNWRSATSWRPGFSPPAPRAFAQPRQFSWHPAAASPSFSRPMRSFAAPRNFSFRGGGGVAMNRGGGMRDFRRR